MKKLIFRLMLCVSLLTLVGAAATACGGGGSVLEGNTVTPVASEMYGQYTNNDSGDTLLLGNPDFYQIQNSAGQTVEEGTWSINGDKIVLSGSNGYFNLMEDGYLKNNLGKSWVRDISN